MKHETKLHGYLFWVRPFWIELVMALFFGFAYSHFSGIADRLPPSGEDLNASFVWAQTIPFLCLTTLLCIATFVDFDERMIPDEVTVFGTLLALVLAALIPESRLLDSEALANGTQVHLHAQALLIQTVTVAAHHLILQAQVQVATAAMTLCST